MRTIIPHAKLGIGREKSGLFRRWLLMQLFVSRGLNRKLRRIRHGIA